MIHQEVTTEGELIAGEAFCHLLNGRMDSKTCQSGWVGEAKLCTGAEASYLFVLLILFIYIFNEVKLTYHVALESGVQQIDSVHMCVRACVCACVCVCVCVHECVFNHDCHFVTPWTITCQASLSLEFPRQEYWSGLPFLTPGD